MIGVRRLATNHSTAGRPHTPSAQNLTPLSFGETLPNVVCNEFESNKWEIYTLKQRDIHSQRPFVVGYLELMEMFIYSDINFCG